MISKHCENETQNNVTCDINVEENINNNSNNDTDDNLKHLECIICFEKIINESPLVDINKISTIERSCECIYKCHKHCIEKWVSTTPRCLLCDSALYFKNYEICNTTTVINLDSLALGSPLLYNFNEPQQTTSNISSVSNYSPPPPYNTVAQYPNTASFAYAIDNDNEDTTSQNSNNTDGEIEIVEINRSSYCVHKCFCFFLIGTVFFMIIASKYS